MCGSSSTTRMLSGFDSPAGTGAASVRAARAPIGSSSVNVAPAPGRVSRVMRPPCSFMMPWQMESPSPVPSPSRLVVKNGSKTRAASSSVIPGPESVTLTAMLSPTRRAVIQIRPDGASLAIAWHALLITFTNTCLIWFAFTSTSGSPGSTSTVASTLCAKLIAQQGESRVQERPNRLSGALPLLAAREGEQVLDDRRGPLGLLADDLKRLLERGRDVARLGEEVAEAHDGGQGRSEEHTSELQSQSNLVCRLLLEKKKTNMQLASEKSSSELEPQDNISCRLT